MNYRAVNYELRALVYTRVQLARDADKIILITCTFECKLNSTHFVDTGSNIEEFFSVNTLCMHLFHTLSSTLIHTNSKPVYHKRNVYF